MKATAEKSSTTTSATATQAAKQPFFAKAGGGNFFAATVQARLKVGKPGDPFEKEADVVADQMVNRAEAAPFIKKEETGGEEKDRLRRQPLAESITPFVQRQEEEPAGEAEDKEEVQKMSLQRQAEEQEPVQAKFIQKAEEKEPPVQAKSAEQKMPMLNPATRNRLFEIKGQGSPLPDSARAFMEAGFGVDFRHVRIHTGSIAADLCNDLHAQAFTHGSDIYFNEGKYNPAGRDDQKLLAHELAHVVQQNKSKGVPLKPASRKIVVKNGLESVESDFLPVSQPKASRIEPVATAAAVAVPQVASPATTPVIPPGSKAIKNGLQGEKEEAPGTEPAALEPAKAPSKPEEDPDFQQAKKIIRMDARKQKSHEPPVKKQAEMQAAAALEENEQKEQSGQEQQAAALEEAAKPKKKFNRVKFKEELKTKIEEKLPDTEEKAKKFPSSGKLEEARSEFGQTVNQEKEQITGPLEKNAQLPAPLGQVTKPETPIPAAKPAHKPSKISPQLATPKPKTDQEISLQHESDNLDKRMVQENITEKQLAESEEPQFERALKKKQDAQREIAAAPARYQEQEAKVLEKAHQQTDKNSVRKLQRMASVKNKSIGNEGVRGSQTQKESHTEKRQREIKNTINGIYSRTKSDVNTILENSSIGVQIKFNNGAQLANLLFNQAVRRRLDDHYGWFTFDDKIAEWAGLSDGVAHIFREEKQNFLNRMDKVLDDIATTVETGLNKALDRIQQGRTELKDFKTTLSKDEQTFANDLIKEVEDKFTDLEASVEEQQEELLETISDLYVENVNKLQEEFDKINEELGSSWIADAINFIGEVANAIRKLGALLRSIVERIADQVNAILAAPKRFFANLVSGIKQGIDKFTSNIGTYLEQGFWMWLTGASSARNIQIPEKMDAEGMFSLALQMLRIDKLFFLERIRVKLGKGVEKLITGAQAAGEKLLEPVRILLQGGIGALWRWVKEEVSSKLQEIFAKIKEEIFEAIIKKALLWVGSLFVPGLGFIRLIQAIYKALRWLVDNINRIVDLVNSFLDSIALAVQGNVGAIVNKVIKGLTLGVVIAIDFLAKLVGLGNFADKLQRAIQSLRKPIQKAIDSLLIKARPVVRKLQQTARKVAKGAKKAVGKVKSGAAKVLGWLVIRKKFKDNKGGDHEIYFQGNQNSAQLYVASYNPKKVHTLLSAVSKFISNPKNTKYQQSYQDAVILNSQILTLESRLTNPRNPTSEKDNEEMNNKIGQLATKLPPLMTIVGGVEPPPLLKPAFANGIKAGNFEVFYLKNGRTSGGSGANTNSGATLAGWSKINQAGLSAKSAWVKMHLFTEQLGGPALDSNLTPARGPQTNSLFYRAIEKHAIDAVNDDKVIWYKLTIGYHGAPNNDYANHIAMEWGPYQFNDKNEQWEKKGKGTVIDGKPIGGFLSQNPEPPDFSGAGDKPNLNDPMVGRVKIENLVSGITRPFAEFVQQVRLAGPFADVNNMEIRLAVAHKKRVRPIDNFNAQVAALKSQINITYTIE